jgi:hypothetical protein
MKQHPELPFPDQDGIAIALAGQWGELAPCWNQVHVLHRNLFLHYLEKTAWSGWTDAKWNYLEQLMRRSIRRLMRNVRKLGVAISNHS